MANEPLIPQPPRAGYFRPPLVAQNVLATEGLGAYNRLVAEWEAGLYDVPTSALDFRDDDCYLCRECISHGQCEP